MSREIGRRLLPKSAQFPHIENVQTFSRPRLHMRIRHAAISTFWKSRLHNVINEVSQFDSCLFFLAISSYLSRKSWTEKQVLFYTVSLDDNQSLDIASDVISQLQLAGGLPEGQKANEEIVKRIELHTAQAMQRQEDATDKQFVYQGQLLVLGDAGVGKTSLVRSLSGKTFDPRQPKTQGMDQSLVDHNWKNLGMKELIFGNLRSFYEHIYVQLTLYGPTQASDVLVRGSFNWKNGFTNPGALILCSVLVIFSFFIPTTTTTTTPTSRPSPLPNFYILLCLVFLYFLNQNCRFRLMATTFYFAVRFRALLTGAFLAFLSVCCYYGKFDVTANILTPLMIILLATGNALYPRKLKFRYNRSLELVCFMPLLVSVLVGYIFCLAVVLLVVGHNKYVGRSVEEPDELVYVARFYCVLLCTVALGKSAIRFMKVINNWWTYRGICTAIFVIIVSFCLIQAMDICVLEYFDCTIFVVYIIDTLFKEWQNIRSLRILGSDLRGSNMFTTVVVEKKELNKKELKSALNKKFSSLKLKILDFAGDEDYYAYHHMFLRRQAIYVIVFNMTEFKKNNFGDIDGKMKRLQFWFESVCSQVPANTPIFLAGTHKGNTERTCMEFLDGHLRRYLWDTYCDELVLNEDDKFIFFPVENSKGKKDTGVQTLQKHIILVAEECKKTIGCDISFSWIRIQDEIITLQEKKAGKFCVTLEELSAAFDNFVCTNWSKETLQYFHEKGLVIYLDRNQDLDLSNWVLLKPEILVDIIIQLVTPPSENTQQRGVRRDWKLLQNKGMLTKPLLKSIISKVQENEEAVTAFLEEYELICPLSNKKVEICSPREQDEKQPTHFVPSLLPMSAEGDLPVWYDDDTDKKFYVFFDRFLPEPLFHRLLSRAHKLSTVAFPNGHTVLYRDAGKFWMTRWQPYRLKLMKDKMMIEVTFSCR